METNRFTVVGTIPEFIFCMLAAPFAGQITTYKMVNLIFLYFFVYLVVNGISGMRKSRYSLPAVRRAPPSGPQKQC